MAAAADAVCLGVRLIRHASSLGAVESTMERRATNAGQEHLPPALLRLSVGIESFDDIRSDLAQALQQARDARLAILDVMLPAVSGFEICEKLRSARPEQPILMLTARGAEEDILRTYDLGVNSFITKPVTFDGLVEVMQELGRYWLEIVELPAPV